MTEQVEVLVVGAGVIGLAVGRALALAGHEVLILDAAEHFGTEISARNSEVIHAGIYYKQGSLKALTCLAGRDRLYAYCRDRGIAHQRLGKLIVASSAAEIPQLSAIKAGAEANGVRDLVLLGHSELRDLEPALDCRAALLSPSTGIIDSHGLMLAYLGDAEAAGAGLVCRASVLGGAITASGFVVEVGGAETLQLGCRWVINCAGLEAVPLARRLGVPAAALPRHYYCKGSYYTLTGRAPFSRLIYPTPEKAGLGVHLTLDLGGQARFGPDVEWVDAPHYDVDPRRALGFYAAIRRYWPGLPDGALQPGYAGIRPKISSPSEAAADFRIDGPGQHGVPGLVNLFGIESPGLTASLALADLVAERVITSS